MQFMVPNSKEDPKMILEKLFLVLYLCFASCTISFSISMYLLGLLVITILEGVYYQLAYDLDDETVARCEGVRWLPTFKSPERLWDRGRCRCCRRQRHLQGAGGSEFRFGGC